MEYGSHVPSPLQYGKQMHGNFLLVGSQLPHCQEGGAAVTPSTPFLQAMSSLLSALKFVEYMLDFLKLGGSIHS